MKSTFRPLLRSLSIFGWLIPAMALSGVVATAATPTVQQALKLLPIQEDVDLSRPTADQTAACKIRAQKGDGQLGWIVEDPNGLTLRKFIDTDRDAVVDQWSYYKDGVEVYRDVDSNHNGKADQYRWFHTGGSRWGLDNDEDGKIDAWKAISAEEVTAEVVAALATRNTARFDRLVLTPGELETLGLGKSHTGQIEEMIGRTAEKFAALVSTQKAVTSTSKWLQFSGTRPGIVPLGTDGSTKDLRVYENVVAIVQDGDAHGQLSIGTLVKVGDAWRLIDVPQISSDGQDEVADSGFFFRSNAAGRAELGETGPSQDQQKLLAELEELDRTATEALTPKQQAEFNSRRTDLLQKIAKQAGSAEERAVWIRQLADMVSASVQSGTFPQGVDRLQALLKELSQNRSDSSLAAYVKFRHMTAAYGLSLQSPKADFTKIQQQWLKDLQQYVADYPAAADAAEAMLQLAIAKEFAGQEDDAKKWYGRIVAAFPDSDAAAKAAGARTRLDSIGKQISLRGKNAAGGVVDLSKYRGKVVLIQYWATWCEPAKADMPALKKMLTKYGRSLRVIGVNLDNSPKTLADFLAKNRLPWPQIFEDGGLDSRPANQLGILTLPTMILVDAQGKVVNRNIQIAELDRELRKLIR